MIAERGVRARRCCRGFEQPAKQVPQEPPRGTDFAMRCPKGDGFRPISVSLARSHDTPMGELPRGCPRGTLLAARLLEGDRTHLLPSPSDASVTSRPDSCRESCRGRRILPRNASRATDSARFPSPSRALAALAAQPASHAPPSTQKARLERRASNTKLCSRTRAYRLNASTGQEEMQAPHSMHSSSLTSA